jgi:hypothetical protein
MADDTTTSHPRDDRGERPSGGRPPGNREPGGFRIRLSDNEMRAARAIQESFGLRSTVAALGFAIRTVAQMLEDGQLDALVAQQRVQGGNRGGDSPRGDGPRGDRRPGGGEGRGSRPERGPRIDPFARPSKPAPVVPVVEEEEPTPAKDEAAPAEPALPDEHAAPAEASEGPSPDAATEASSTDSVES